MRETGLAFVDHWQRGTLLAEEHALHLYLHRRLAWRRMSQRRFECVIQKLVVELCLRGLLEGLVRAAAAVISVPTVVSHAKAGVRLVVRASNLIIGE